MELLFYWDRLCQVANIGIQHIKFCSLSMSTQIHSFSLGVLFCSSIESVWLWLTYHSGRSPWLCSINSFFLPFPSIERFTFHNMWALVHKTDILLIYYLVHLFLVRKIDVFSHPLYEWLRLSKMYKRRL